MNYQKDQFSCPVEATLFLIGGKYKPVDCKMKLDT